ncbi:FAD-binding oxidoreductase [Streptomyces sp. NPDC004031]
MERLTADGWRRARLTARHAQTPSGSTLFLDTPSWPGHLPGQHVDVRLTADDGYQAVRSYSLAAPADGARIELGVQDVPDGEVSAYLVHDLPVGADVEVRGPLGGWFRWDPRQEGPVLLAAGGCGIVPLMAMVRANYAGAAAVPMHLTYSVRDPDQVWYRDELAAARQRGLGVTYVHTRRSPDGRPPARIGAGDLVTALGADLGDLRCFVCGPTGFVERAAELLVDGGHPPGTIRTERFG